MYSLREKTISEIGKKAGELLKGHCNSRQLIMTFYYSLIFVNTCPVLALMLAFFQYLSFREDPYKHVSFVLKEAF